MLHQTTVFRNCRLHRSAFDASLSQLFSYGLLDMPLRRFRRWQRLGLLLTARAQTAETHGHVLAG
jgi:hypothetical protein